MCVCVGGGGRDHGTQGRLFYMKNDTKESDPAAWASVSLMCKQLTGDIPLALMASNATDVIQRHTIGLHSLALSQSQGHKGRACSFLFIAQRRDAFCEKKKN